MTLDATHIDRPIGDPVSNVLNWVCPFRKRNPAIGIAFPDPTVNGDIANKPFTEKKVIYHGSPLLITQEIANFNKWEPDEIEQRQAARADEALKIWTN